MSSPPLDLAALAREWLHNGITDDDEGDIKSLTALLQKVATQSHAAGRAEGLGEAAMWHEEIADSIRKAYGDKDAVREEDHRRYARGFRAALASSDPAPGDQPAPNWQVHSIAGLLARDEARRSDPALGDQVAEVWTEEDFAWADRETDRLMEYFDSAEANPEPSPAMRQAAVDHAALLAQRPTPAHPTEPGEVERLRQVLEFYGQHLDDCSFTDGEFETGEACDCGLAAALSTPSPAPKGETE